MLVLSYCGSIKHLRQALATVRLMQPREPLTSHWHVHMQAQLNAAAIDDVLDHFVVKGNPQK